jgi:hypothetical protein
MSLLEELLESIAVGVAQRRDAGCHSPALSQPSPPEVTHEEALRNWHALRRSEYGMDTIDYKHVCTRGDCVQTASIECISHGLHLYGCINSGVHHICNLDAECKVRYTSPDGGIFCTFSRKFIETYVDQTQWGRSMVVNDYYDGATASRNDALTLASDAQAPHVWHEHVYGVEYGNEAKSGKRRRFSMRVVEPGRDMTKVAEATDVSVRAITGDCGAEGDSDTPAPPPRLGSSAPASEGLPPPPLSPPPPQRQSQQRAIVSNTTPAQSVWMPLRGRVLREHFTRYTHNDIGKVISLLFDVSYRRDAETKLRETAETAALDEMCRYYRQCAEAQTLPNTHVRDSIYRRHMREKPSVTQPGKLDEDRLTRLKAFVYELWRVMLATPYFKRSPNKFRLVNHVLGALYMLREPFTLARDDGVVFEEILPRDDFLNEHLPAQNLLKDWRARAPVYSMSRVLAVKGVVNGRLEFSKTGVSSGRNTIKDALMSIETDDERWYVVERLRRAYEHGTFEPDDVIYFTEI